MCREGPNARLAPSATNASRTPLSSTGQGYRRVGIPEDSPRIGSARIDAPFCYLTTTGRRTGRPHTIEIWFATGDGGSTLYLLSGARDAADWVRNVRAEPAVSVRVGRDGLPRRATARLVEAGTGEDASARRLLLDKYQSPGSRDLESFGRNALVVALDVAQDGDEGVTRTDATT